MNSKQADFRYHHSSSCIDNLILSLLTTVARSIVDDKAL